jgi:16S rRNA (cytosine1402-N4)-methyltransferase
VHTPVLLEEVLGLVGGDGLAPGSWIVDGTLGAAGHAAACLERFPDCRVLGIDQDPEILALARARLEPFGDRARVRQTRMARMSELIREEGIGRPVAVLLDLGASSLQLDSKERGFSFLVDGPLDMRMDPTRERTAADIVNHWDESDLADLFFYEGDETHSRAIAKAIVKSRRRAPFLRTAALSEVIAGAAGPRRGKTHPATRSFQALRRAVNEEGEQLLGALDAAEWWLADAGRLVVISFHSGEDGAVKRFFADGAKRGRWEIVTKKPVSASRSEIAKNRRSRSAQVRAASRKRGGGVEAGCTELLA